MMSIKYKLPIIAGILSMICGLFALSTSWGGLLIGIGFLVMIISLSIYLEKEDKKKKAKQQAELKQEQEQQKLLYQQTLEVRKREEAERQKQQQADFEKRCIALQTSNIDHLSGVEFEKYAAWLLAKNGYQNIRFTQASGDYGADILAENAHGISFCIQCKRQAQNVGVQAIQEVYTAKQYYKCQKAMVMTNAHFTPNAKSMATRCEVCLLDRTALIQLICETQDNTLKRN